MQRKKQIPGGNDRKKGKSNCEGAVRPMAYIL